MPQALTGPVLGATKNRVVLGPDQGNMTDGSHAEGLHRSVPSGVEAQKTPVCHTIARSTLVSLQLLLLKKKTHKKKTKNQKPLLF